MQSIRNEENISTASLTSLVSKRDTLLQELEYFLNLAPDSKEGGKLGSELACRVREHGLIFLFLSLICMCFCIYCLESPDLV